VDDISATVPAAPTGKFDPNSLIAQRGQPAGMRGVWRGAEGEQPVAIVRRSEADPTMYQVRLADGTTTDLPMSELFAVTGDGKELRRMTDIEVMHDARQRIDYTDWKSIEDARKELRTMWDREVSARWKAPKLESLMQRFYRNGVVSIPDGVKGLEDILGQAVAGIRLDSMVDIEALVKNYADMKRQIEAAKRGAATAQTEYVSAWNRAEPYNIPQVKPGEFNPLGMGDQGGDARKIYNEVNPTTTPTVGDVAYYNAEMIQKGLKIIEQNIGEILTGRPNTLTQAQKLRVVDEAARLGAI
jgi:hypothetical protein